MILVDEVTNVTKPTDGDWGTLTRDLSRRVSAHAPAWTEPAGSDPGISLVELFGFLAESMLTGGDLSPEARARLRDLVTRLERAGDSVCEDATLTRNRYFSGKLMSVDDFELEQTYQRTRLRRHNRLLHGVGIVRGLGIALEPRQGGGEPAVVVSPGIAIAPDGEELVVCEPLTVDVCQGRSVCYVTVALVERPVDPTPHGEPSRIEESAEVATSEGVQPGHLAIARLVRERGTWRADPSFAAPRVS
jgi:hypothetical protein